MQPLRVTTLLPETVNLPQIVTVFVVPVVCHKHHNHHLLVQNLLLQYKCYARTYHK